MHTPNDLNQSRIVLDRGNRNELVELARCRHRAWRRAPAIEEARGRRERVAETSKLPNRRREEAEKAGRKIEGIAVAFEAGRDGFWLVRWLRARGIEAHVIHASS